MKPTLRMQNEVAKEALIAVNRMRLTPIVDDDFPQVRDRADALMHKALELFQEESLFLRFSWCIIIEM